MKPEEKEQLVGRIGKEAGIFLCCVLAVIVYFFSSSGCGYPSLWEGLPVVFVFSLIVYLILWVLRSLVSPPE